MKPSLAFFILLFFYPLIFSGQQRWMRSYYTEYTTSYFDIAEDYDRGYLIAVNVLSRSAYHTRLLKVDINGEAEWEKIVKHRSNALATIWSIARNEEGDIFLAGGYQLSHHDPIIVKLNVCGEMIWCKRISTSISNDYALKICPLKDGGCVVSVCNGGFVWNEDKVCLTRLDTEGDFLWQQCYNGLDTNIYFIEHEDLIQTPDQGFLITGNCQYSDTTPIVESRWLAYLIKTDSSGLVQWEFLLDRDSSENFGEAHRSLLSPDGHYYYTSLSRGLLDSIDTGWVPALLKIDLSGNKTAVYNLFPEVRQTTGIHDIVFQNDSMLTAIMTWKDDNEELLKQMILIDTTGNIRHEILLPENIYDAALIRDEENKLLILTRKLTNGTKTDLVLYKYNEDFIDDTLYLQPIIYDTLCPYTILADTLYLDDCDLYLGENENNNMLPSKAGYILVKPIPCKEYIEITFYEDDRPEHLDFYSAYGSLLYSQDIIQKDKELRISTMTFPKGVAFAVFRYPSGKNSVVKLIKM